MGEVIPFRRPVQESKKTPDDIGSRLERIKQSIGRINELMAQLNEKNPKAVEYAEKT